MKIFLYSLYIISILWYVAIASWWQLVVAILLLWVINMGAKLNYIYNPFNVIVVTFISYLLYYQPIGGFFLAKLSLTTHSLIALSFFSIILGFLFCHKLKIRPIKIGKQYSESFFFTFIIGLFPTLLSIYLFGNILDMTGEDMMETKEKMSLPFIGQLAYWLPASIIVACKKNNTICIVISVCTSFIAALMSITKTGFLVAFLFLCIGLIVFKPDIVNTKIFKLAKKYALAWIPIIVLTFFSYNNNIRQEASVGDDMEYVQKANSSIYVRSDNLGQGIFLNYLYYCSPWSNLDYNIKLQKQKGFGCNTFAQFFHLLRMPEHRIEKLNPTFLNTHSFLTDYYIDFGYVGAIIASFFLGFFIFYCYRKFGCSDDPILLAFYVLVMFATIMLFFSNHFNNGYLLNYFITFVGYSMFYRKLNKS